MKEACSDFCLASDALSEESNAVKSHGPILASEKYVVISRSQRSLLLDCLNLSSGKVRFQNLNLSMNSKIYSQKINKIVFTVDKYFV